MRFSLLRWFRGPGVPGPPHPFQVRLLYTEVVRGEPRSFRHEIQVDALDRADARDLARAHFRSSAFQSGVGWARFLETIEILDDGTWHPFPEDPGKSGC